MRSDSSSGDGSRAFHRFCLTGVAFTILGPTLFWLAYPLGPFLAVALTELTVHTIRFLTFRAVVFPARKGYDVSLANYVLSALPVSLTGFISVAVLRNRLDRTSLTLAGASIAIAVGFLWSHYIFARKTPKT